jgi:hypothetical protein
MAERSQERCGEDFWCTEEHLAVPWQTYLTPWSKRHLQPNHFLFCSSTNILVTDRVMQQDSASYNYRESCDPSKGAIDTLN